MRVSVLIAIVLIELFAFMRWEGWINTPGNLGRGGNLLGPMLIHWMDYFCFICIHFVLLDCLAPWTFYVANLNAYLN